MAYKTEAERIKAKKESNRRYDRSARGRARNKRATKKYYYSAKGQATYKRYISLPKTQKRIREWRNIPENRKKKNLAQKRYRRTAAGMAVEQRRKKTKKYKIRIKIYDKKRKHDPKRIKWSKEYNKKPEVIKRRRERAKGEKYVKNRRAYLSKQQKENTQFRLRQNVRKRIVRYLKGVKGRKFGKTNELLGCDWKFLKKHLENQFYNRKKTNQEMSWNNYGKWHVDHIIPLDSFDLTIKEQQFKACHYTNLQPLWEEDNIAKNNKLNWSK